MPPPLDARAIRNIMAESSRLRRRPAVVLRSPTIEPVAIYCGAEDPITAGDIFEYDYDEHRPGTVQMLPGEQILPPPREKSRMSRSNGCGTQVHDAVCIMRRNQCWYGWEEGLALTVVPLETSYFPSGLVESLELKNGGRSANCGCVANGLGCAVCGNPLGKIQVHCATHGPGTTGRAGYVFLASAVSPAPTSPSPQDESAIVNAAPSSPRDPPIDWIGESSAAATSRDAPQYPMTNNIYSPVSPAGSSTPFIPPALLPPASPPTATPAPPAPSARRYPSATARPPPSAAVAAPDAASPPRPRRRRTLRRPGSVERYFGIENTTTAGDASTSRARAMDAALTAGDTPLVDGVGPVNASSARDIWLGLRRSSIWDGSWEEHRPTWDSPPDDSNGAPQAMGGPGPYGDMPPLLPIDAFDYPFLPEPHVRELPAAPRDNATLDTTVLDTSSTGPSPRLRDSLAAASSRVRDFRRLLDTRAAALREREEAALPQSRARDARSDRRMRDIEHHLDTINIRVAALDAAASDVRLQIEALRPPRAQQASPVVPTTHHPPSPSSVEPLTAGSTQQDQQPEYAGVIPPQSSVDDPSTTSIPIAARRPSPRLPPPTGRSIVVTFGPANFPLPIDDDAVTAPVAQPSPNAELFVSTRAAIAEERARLSEMQERLSALGSAATPAPPLVTVTAPAPAPAPAPGFATDMRAIVREQTELLARVTGLMADIGRRVGTLEADTASSSDSVTGALTRAREALERAGGGAAAVIARAREALERTGGEGGMPPGLDRGLRMRAGADDAFRLVGLVDGEGLRSQSQEAEAEQELARHPLAPAARDAGSGQEDKRPRRIFFER
ncbi:hypothetical protein C8R44DRAFT_861492 [Mycena epipterygia]|nr:hypothetical protein C8R44DRAFT_861492 [Mycena epipterygia]